MEIADKIDKKPAFKIDLAKGKLPFKGKGLSNSVNIANCTLEEQRRHGVEKLAAAYRIFSRKGFDLGVAGHISFRDPEHRECFWINPLGYHFGQMKVSDLVLMHQDGELIYGKERTGDAAQSIHSNIYKNRDDINAVAHAHPMYGKTFSTLGKTLDPITQDSCAFYERTAIFADYDGVANGPQEGINISKALADKDFLILQNHGILTTGSMIDTTIWYFLNMEDACKSQLIAESVGKPIKIPHDVACNTRDYVANDLSAFVSLQPLLDLLWEEEKDFLD
jgi:ribulose-5-phosphate 4-epimerase/fuculose-1-phosphate aldolase